MNLIQDTVGFIEYEAQRHNVKIITGTGSAVAHDFSGQHSDRAGIVEYHTQCD